MKPGVIDLAELKNRADARDAAADQAAAAEATRHAIAWDKAMRRAFKGILPRPEAHRFLLRARDD